MNIPWWRNWDAQRKAARARRWRREQLRVNVGLILNAPSPWIDRVIDNFERQIQATRADTE